MLTTSQPLLINVLFFIRSNQSKMKLLRDPTEHLGCHWTGSQRALHQDSCNDFTTLLYSGSNHNSGGSHTAGNCCKVTRTGQRPPIIKGDDGPERVQVFAKTQHRSCAFRQGHLNLGKICGHHPLYFNGKMQFGHPLYFYSCCTVAVVKKKVYMSWKNGFISVYLCCFI